MGLTLALAGSAKPVIQPTDKDQQLSSIMTTFYVWQT